MDVEYEDILSAVKKHGDDLDKIQDETDAGTGCECCLEEDCSKVDIPLLEAIKKAKKELEEL
jgi:NAD(P)H-nitrite reductase large subunit